VLKRALALGAILLVIDQISKWLILDFFAESASPIEVLPFFNLVLVFNCGISFGIFSHCAPTQTWLLIGLSTIIVIALLFWLKSAKSWIVALAIGAVIGGAVGNIVDRAVPTRGAVVDFLDFHVLGVHWPAFNVADSAIVLGVIALLYGSMKLERDQVETTSNAD